ncbi:uncharacterized protein LOC132832959 [Hemiscyllium ocellatum]|uniref:uncharacterized protein LOC132832959 n=1 Tax=Hemiscyllium ocellatum TaxID=170820 RepID=UPI0029665FB3|nr:uncharacterized protein LOC132832959 [Hemiscyllium ocellatum]
MFGWIGPQALLLFFVLWISSTLAEDFQLSCSQRPVVAEVGDTVVLECQLAPSLPLKGLEIRWTKGKELVHLYRFEQDENTEQSADYKDRTQLFASEFQRGNISLKLKQVVLPDSGIYKCFVESEARGFKDANVILKVASFGEWPTINLNKYTGSGIQLQCKSENWFPSPIVQWSNEKGNILTQHEQPGTEENSLVTVKNNIDVTSDSGNTFSCLLQSDILNKAVSATFYVPDEFYPVTSIWLYMFLLIFFGIFAVIAGLFFFFRRQQKYIRELTARPSVNEYKAKKSENAKLTNQMDTYWKELGKIRPLPELAVQRMTNAADCIFLDSDTANSRLLISSDLTTVSCTAGDRIPADSSRRFQSRLAVLGKTGFASGRHYWLVKVDSHSAWDLGVARESVTGEGNLPLSPENGYWTIGHDGERYWANFTNPLEIMCRENLGRIGIYVNYDAGQVLFLDGATYSHLHSFTCSFEGLIFPFLNLSESGECSILQSTPLLPNSALFCASPHIGWARGVPIFTGCAREGCQCLQSSLGLCQYLQRSPKEHVSTYIGCPRALCLYLQGVLWESVCIYRDLHLALQCCLSHTALLILAKPVEQPGDCLESVGDVFRVTGPETPIIASVGGVAVLECQLIPEKPLPGMKIEWARSDSEQHVPIHSYTFGLNVEEQPAPAYRNRTEFFKQEFNQGNVSLRLRDVRLQDEGDYLCMVESRGFIEQAPMKLKATSFGQRPVIRLEGYQHDEIGLHCNSSSWYPVPMMHWEDGKGKNMTERSRMTSTKTADGLYEVSSSIEVTAGSSNTFRCLVKSAILKSSRQSSLSIPDEFFPRMSRFFIAFIVFLILLLGLLAAASYYQYKQQKQIKELLKRPTIKDFKDLSKRTEQLQNDVDNAHANLDQEKKLCQTAAERVITAAVPVTYDPETANPYLIISENRLTVTFSDSWQELPESPKRFTSRLFVIAEEGYESGSQYWEVLVGNKPDWDLGVAKESISREEWITLSPENGYWSIGKRGDTYEANEISPETLEYKTMAQKIGIYLNCEEGIVRFYDADHMVLIHSFTAQFTEKIYPFFSPWGSREEMTICPFNSPLSSVKQTLRDGPWTI